jgi:hypothetical protein
MNATLTSADRQLLKQLLKLGHWNSQNEVIHYALFLLKDEIERGGRVAPSLSGYPANCATCQASYIMFWCRARCFPHGRGYYPRDGWCNPQGTLILHNYNIKIVRTTGSTNEVDRRPLLTALRANLSGFSDI